MGHCRCVSIGNTIKCLIVIESPSVTVGHSLTLNR
ncbi:hypothetical protein FHW04_001597 [Pantoea sp. AN62]